MAEDNIVKIDKRRAGRPRGTSTERSIITETIIESNQTNLDGDESNRNVDRQPVNPNSRQSLAQRNVGGNALGDVSNLQDEINLEDIDKNSSSKSNAGKIFSKHNQSLGNNNNSEQSHRDDEDDDENPSSHVRDSGNLSYTRGGGGNNSDGDGDDRRSPASTTPSEKSTPEDPDENNGGYEDQDEYHNLERGNELANQDQLDAIAKISQDFITTKIRQTEIESACNDIVKKRYYLNQVDRHINYVSKEMTTLQLTNDESIFFGKTLKKYIYREETREQERADKTLIVNTSKVERVNTFPPNHKKCDEMIAIATFTTQQLITKSVANQAIVFLLARSKGTNPHNIDIYKVQDTSSRIV